MTLCSKLLYFLSLVLIFNINTALAINSTADLHQNELSDGLSSQTDFSLAGAKGNVDKYDATFSLDLFHHNEYRTWAMVLVAARSEAANQLTSDNLFSHVRLFLPRAPQRDLELYLQLSQDEFSRLEYRGLFGGGVRWRHQSGDTKSQIFSGLGVMYEREKIAAQGLLASNIEEQIRLNLYAVIRHPLENQAELEFNGYTQPRIDVPSDTRAQLGTSISFVLTERTRVSLSITVSHDSQPPDNVDHTDLTYSSGISLYF